MEIPLQITFRNLPPSPAIAARIRAQAKRLERFHDRITRCRVVVESPHHHHRQGNLYHVRIDLSVPGGELVVNREAAQHQAYEDAYVAIRDAFDAASRQLEDFARRQRGELKTHEEPMRGEIVRLLAERDCGFIQGPNGGEIYFHRNSVVDEVFERLCVGTTVRFVLAEKESTEGPQATTVRVERHVPPA